MADCQDNDDEGIILIEDVQNEFLVDLDTPLQTLTLTEQTIEFIEADYPPIDQITILDETELIVGSPPPAPAGSACFSCTLTQFVVAPAASQEIIDLDMDVTAENSAIFSIDLMDDVGSLYRSFVYRVVVKVGEVDYNVQKGGDMIQNLIVFNRSATGITAQYTNLHSRNVTVVLRRV